jgi:salicylate hydroxylase
MASIGIVGAGIGGLTTALAVARTHCHQVTVYETKQVGVAEPAPLHLPPNATRVFKALGLEAALLEQAHHAQRQQVRTGKQGFQLAELPLGELALARYNAPYLTMPQDQLIHLITTALPATITLHNHHHCTQINAQQGTLEFRNGHQAEHDLIVIADGANSELRPQLKFDTRPQSTGQQLVVGVVDNRATLPQQLPSGLNQWLGPDRWFTHWPLDDQGGIGFMTVSEPTATQAQLADVFNGWHPLVASVIAQAHHFESTPISIWPALKNWQQNKAVLLGDAAHPVLPFTDQSAALAIEDAWVLSRMLEQQEHKPEEAASEYQRFRLRRCERVQLLAQAQGTNLQTPEQQAIWKRNIMLSLGSRFLPEWALAKFDWLYGYDCVRGFH